MNVPYTTSRDQSGLIKTVDLRETSSRARLAPPRYYQHQENDLPAPIRDTFYKRGCDYDIDK